MGTIALGAALPVLAQNGSTSSSTEGGHAHVAPTHPLGSYQGVTPGESDAPPAEARARRRAEAARSGRRRRSAPVHLLTWPGFQAHEDGSSRFFLQTSSTVETSTSRAPGRFELILKNTRVHLRTNRLPLETRYFNTPVVRALVERRGHDLAIVFVLRAEVAPRISTETASNGYHYVFVDFPAGDYLPAELQAERAAPAHEDGSDDAEGPTGDPDAPPPGGIRVYDEAPPGS